MLSFELRQEGWGGVSCSSSKMKEESARHRDQSMQKLRSEEVLQEQKCDQCRMRGDYMGFSFRDAVADHKSSYSLW